VDTSNSYIISNFLMGSNICKLSQ